MATAKKAKAKAKATGKKNTGANDLAGKVQAIDKAQAVIEFNLDGTIITANDNFLKTLGYTLDEIKDKHHRMYCDAAYTDSPEYANFWAKLNRGEFDAGVYKRIGKGGKEVWMQATCTPVLSADGRPTKVIELATDVTTQRLELDDLRDELKVRTDIMNTTSIVSEADLKGDIVTVNEKFLEVSKYPKDELIGKGYNTTHDPDMPKETFKTLWQTIGRGQIFRGVIKNRAKDGTPYYEDAVIAPILGKNGKPRKYLGVGYDITVQEIARQNMKGIFDAIDKSYLSADYNLDGTVLAANGNFLKTLGYTMDEIKGKYHRMFCETVYANSGEYTAFLAKLNRGEFDAGVYKQIGKGGNEVWLQASYNPILDGAGRALKVVEFAIDITAQKKAQAELEAFMAEAQNSLSALAEGDMTQPMSGTYQGELEKIKSSINAALTTLTTTIISVREAAESVTTGAEQISKGSEDLSQRTAEQASALEETSASMEEMTSTVKQSADNAKQANQLAIAARDVADKGGLVTTKAVAAMGEINKSSKKISDIITVIDEIAFQTNLLALNAAVEAARAGEHGRGFAVVAAEVRNLAQRAATAAKEIKGLINESIQRVTDGSELVNQSGKTLEEIVSSAKRVTDIIAEISAASQEQAVGIDQVNKAIMQMDEVTQQNAALVEETTSASQSMKEQAGDVTRQLEFFKTAQAEGQHTTQVVKRATQPIATRPAVHANGPKPMVKRPTPTAKPAEKKEPVGVGASNGKDRRSKGEEFEEF